MFLLTTLNRPNQAYLANLKPQKQPQIKSKTPKSLKSLKRHLLDGTNSWVLVVVSEEEVTGLALGSGQRAEGQTSGQVGGDALSSADVDGVAGVALEAPSGVDSALPGGASPVTVGWQLWSSALGESSPGGLALSEGLVWDTLLTGEAVWLSSLEVTVLAAGDGGWVAGLGLLLAEAGGDGGLLDEVARLADNAVVSVLPNGAVLVLDAGVGGAAVALGVVVEAA